MRVDLPDMETLFELADRIYKLAVEQGLLEIKIKTGEADISREAQRNEKYFSNGKPPSQTLVDNTFKYTGFSGELLPDRMKLAEIESELSLLKTKLDLNKAVIEIWRTQESSERRLSG